jgi:hypothetical protein
MVWKDLAHLEAHMDSETFRILLGATSVLTAPSGFRFIAADSTPTVSGECLGPRLRRFGGRAPLA